MIVEWIPTYLSDISTDVEDIQLLEAECNGPSTLMLNFVAVEVQFRDSCGPSQKTSFLVCELAHFFVSSSLHRYRVCSLEKAAIRFEAWEVIGVLPI